MAIRYRSKFEEEIAKKLKGTRARNEKLVIPFYKIHTYKPDWVLPNGIIIEGKGRFTSYDRAKHLLIKEQQPNLDIRFVFKYDNKLHKTIQCKTHTHTYYVATIHYISRIYYYMVHHVRLYSTRQKMTL